MDVVEKVARAIAAENSDNFDGIPDNKSEWTKNHGHFNGRFRDVNEPFKGDYLEMARAAIDAYEATLPPQPSTTTSQQENGNEFDTGTLGASL